MPSWTRDRIWLLSGVTACVVLLAAWFLVLAPQRATAAEVREQVTSTEQQNDILAARVKELAAQFKELPLRKEELAELRTQLPSEAGLADVVRQAEGAAAGAGVSLQSITPGPPEVYGDAAVAAESVDTSGPTLVSIPITFEVIGDFLRAQEFLRAVQDELPRSLLITDLRMTAEDAAEGGGGRPTTQLGDVTMTVAGSVFVLDETPATVDPVVPSAVPGATATSAPGATPTTTPGATPTEAP